MNIKGKNNKNLLNEITVVRDDKIKQAIQDVRRVRIYYDDHKDVISKTKGYAVRYILPVAYGLLKNGKKAVRAYQTAGSTKRGVPKWKLFLVDNIVDWQNSTRTFKKYKQALINLGLNVHGDKHMTTLYAITPLANNNIQINKYSHEIDPEPITKNDVKPSSLSQNPNIVTPKTEPSLLQREPYSIDNDTKNNYSSNKEFDTKPILKKNIVPQTSDNEKTTSLEKPVQYTTEPVTKDEVDNISNIENDDINVEDNDFVKNFQDLTNRMNNLYNNEDEIE